MLNFKSPLTDKKVLLWIGILFVVLIVCLMIALLAPAPCTVTSEPIVIHANGYSLANHRQYTSSVEMMAHDGKLYFLTVSCSTGSHETKYYSYLSVFEGGTATRLEKITGTVIAMHDGYVYFRKTNDDYDFAYYCYEISTDQVYHLVTTDNHVLNCAYLSEDGILFVPAGASRNAYYPITGNEVDDLVIQQETYVLNGSRYTLEKDLADTDVVCYDSTGTRISLSESIPYGQQKSIIPCNGGLLVHNEGQGDLLYFIEGGTGDVVELFTVPCIVSTSAVNVYGHYVYLSFLRYEKHGEFGLLRYENDVLEGTYRINLEDYSVEKISDEIYSGLYIFDDTGIYACDEFGHIYKLDFDGNVVLTLLE